MERPRCARPIPLLLVAGCLGLCGLLVAGGAVAGDPIFGGNEADAILGADEPMRGRTLDDVDLSFVIDNDIVNGVLQQPPFEAELACTFFAQSGQQGRKGVKVRFGGTVVTPDGTETIPPVNKRTNKNGKARATWDLQPDEQATGGITVNVSMDPNGAKKADVWGGNCRVGVWKPCQADDTTLCLNDNRFRVNVDWRDFDGSKGPAMVMGNPSDAQGAFYFFNPNNRNLLIDLFNNCKNNDFFWVFAAAQTDVEYTLTVVDTQTGESKAYSNPLGNPAPAITDTQAFATCP